MGDAVAEWYQRLAKLRPSGTAHDPTTNTLRPDWRSPIEPGPLPEAGEDLGRLVDFVLETLAPDAQVVGHPGFFAYVAGAANLISVLGQTLSAAINPYTGTYSTAPGFVRLEDEVLRWFASIVGYPEGSGGLLTTGSSMAILSAVIAARERADAPWDKARAYVSDQAHHSVGKALFAAGFKPRNLVVLPSRDYRLDPGRLADALCLDRSRGLVPVLVVSTAGSTNTGRVDPIAEIAAIASESGAWHHCDAAYGGFFRLLEEASILRGMESADSISLDPHKSLAMPYGTGALLVRDVGSLRFPRGLDAGYMPPLEDEDLHLEYAELGPELTRDFRGLRVWLAIRALGIAPFRENLRVKWRLARRLAGEIERMPSLELVTAPDLSISSFRVRVDEDGSRTRALLADLNAGGRYFLTGTSLEGRAAIRVCLLGFRIDEASIDGFVDELKALAGKMEDLRT